MIMVKILNKTTMENIKTFSFENIRMKGKNQCGYDFLAHVNKNIFDDPLIEYSTFTKYTKSASK